MLRPALFAVVAVGLSAAACSYNSTTTIAVPGGPGPVLVASPSAEACVDYGFVPGTIAYNRCVEREHAARVAGRMGRGYAEAQLANDARDACISYGLRSGRPLLRPLRGPRDGCPPLPGRPGLCGAERHLPSSRICPAGAAPAAGRRSGL